MSRRRWSRPIWGTVLFRAVLLTAALWSMAVAAAALRVQSSSRPEDTLAACGWFPADAGCWSTAARQAEELGRPDLTLWQRALEADARAVAPAISAAILLEAEGRIPEAERLLVRASRFNRLFVSRWALASFYFRHGRRDSFREAGRLALSCATDDPSALFRLFDLSAGPGGPDWASIVPLKGPVAAHWVSYLVRQGQWPEVSAAFARLIPANHAPVPSGPLIPALLQASAVALSSGNAPIARLGWNQLANAGWIPRSPLLASQPITNTEFALPLEPPVFDWRFYRIPGLSLIAGAPPGALKLTLTGQQADIIPIVEQTLILRHTARYRLSCEFRERGLHAASSALYWAIEAAFGEELARGPAAFAAEDWQPWVFEFSPPRTTPVRLVLKAARRLGETRPSGEGWIRGVRLQLVANSERAAS